MVTQMCAQMLCPECDPGGMGAPLGCEPGTERGSGAVLGQGWQCPGQLLCPGLSTPGLQH